MGTRIPPKDAELFRTTVGEVRRLQSDRIELPARRPAPIPQQRLRDEEAVIRDMLSDPIDPAEMETGEELSYARPGLQHTVLRKLRRGQCSVEKELDLHGLTVEEARQALATFLHHCTTGRHRCVRIIHGKGNSSYNKRPVLKGRVNHWLRQRSEVLAFCSARPVDGGTGALYVLLKRRGEHG